jgi:hypothetical protein
VRLLAQSDRVVDAHDPGFTDRGVDAKTAFVLLRRGAQDAQIARQILLCQRGGDAPKRRLKPIQLDLLAKHQRLLKQAVLDEATAGAHRVDIDVRDNNVKNPRTLAGDATEVARKVARDRMPDSSTLAKSQATSTLPPYNRAARSDQMGV